MLHTCTTCVLQFTNDTSASCLQPCNPAVGGPAKSQLVHEVDAMGGEIGKMADRCYLQKRVLNRSKVRHMGLAPQGFAMQHSISRCMTVGLYLIASCLQGPAVWALRAQTDKLEYARVMRGVLESTPNLSIREVCSPDAATCSRPCHVPTVVAVKQPSQSSAT
jgi:tRNA uridine 5-carboxymethylaminomethyl modification enzyme